MQKGYFLSKPYSSTKHIRVTTDNVESGYVRLEPTRTYLVETRTYLAQIQTHLSEIRTNLTQTQIHLAETQTQI